MDSTRKQYIRQSAIAVQTDVKWAAINPATKAAKRDTARGAVTKEGDAIIEYFAVPVRV